MCTQQQMQNSPVRHAASPAAINSMNTNCDRNIERPDHLHAARGQVT
jgi:hypothetical protein